MFPSLGGKKLQKKTKTTWSLFVLQSPGVGDGAWAAVSTRCNGGLHRPHAQSCWCQCSVRHCLRTKLQCSLWVAAWKGYHWQIIGGGMSHQSERREKIECWHNKKRCPALKSKGYQTLNVHKSISPLWEGHKSRLLEGSHQPTHQLYWKLFIWPDRHWVIRLWNTPCTTQTVFSFGLIIYCK